MAVKFHGIIPAHLLPFDNEFAMDEAGLRRHVRRLIDTEGVTGVTTVAHASEVASLTDDEQLRLLEIVLDEVGGTKQVIAGIYDTDNRSAARRAAALTAAGADALLVFPCASWDMGHQGRPEMARGYFADIAESTDLPMIAFVYPTFSDLHIPTDSLVQICAEVPNVAAVKEWSNDAAVYERNFRELKALDKEIAVLSSYSKALLQSLIIGADGILSGHGSVIAHLQSQLFSAVQRGDIPAARGVAARIYASTSRVYKEPFLDGHNRMKMCLHLLGEFDSPIARRPLMPLSDQERAELAASLKAAQITAPAMS
jgi:4-hydroxy-tetrahydrodipicolinate synthase